MSLNAVKAELKSEINVRSQARENTTSLVNLWKETEEIKKEQNTTKATSKSNTDHIQRLTNENALLREQLETLRRRNIRLEQYDRRENLRLVGVEEQNEMSCKDLVQSILCAMGFGQNQFRFHAIHRIRTIDNPSMQNSDVNPRQIIIHFLCREDRNCMAVMGENQKYKIQQSLLCA